MKKKLLPALLLLAARVHADPPPPPAWADAAVAGWNENILPAEDIEWKRFVGEDGVERTVWYLRRQVPQGNFADVPLFVLDPNPVVEERRMKSKVGFYPDRFQDMDVQLAIFKKNQVSEYYIRKHDGSDTWIGRRDRPEVNIKATLPVGSAYGIWFLYSDIVHHDKKKHGEASMINGTAPWARVQLFKPVGVAPAAASPITGQPGYVHNCKEVHKGWAGGSEGWQQVYKGWTPQELELWQGDFHSLVATPGIWNALYNAATKAVAEKGDYSKAADFIDWYRQQATLALDATGKQSSMSPPADRFTPEESRYLICRMRHIGKQADFLAKIASTPASGMPGFVSFWRQYLLKEFKQQLDESKAAGRLPHTPDHAALDEALHKRADDALAGKLAGVNAAPQKKTPAPGSSGKTPAGKPTKVENIFD